MARPLRYDDQFTSIINERVTIRLFFCFKLKAQSTCFYKRINLLQGLLLCSLIDIIIAVYIFLQLIHVADYNSFTYLNIKNYISILGILFGFIGFDAAANLKKRSSRLYRNWRIFITILTIACELSVGLTGVLYHDENIFIYAAYMVCYIGVSTYMNKIVESFNTRLMLNQELLIVHGRYLEKMVENDSYRMNDNIKKYIPPVKVEKKVDITDDVEMVKVPNITQLGSSIEEDVFEPKAKNPFLNALRGLS
jgi:hypothetical protein